MRRILYATDGSEASRAGAHFLARLPLGTDCRVKLLTVLPDGEEGDAKNALAPALEILQHTCASVETKVRCGFADLEILRAADPATSLPPTDLVVVGSRGLTGFARFLVGSTAERVARHARCPVLVARPLVDDLRRVIVGIDGSEGAARAAEWLKSFPLPHGCEIRLVTVLPHLEALSPSRKLAWSAEMRPLSQQQRDEALGPLDELAASFTRAGKPGRGELRSGNPAESLLQSVEEQKADLIVVGSRGISAVERFLLGSVSEKVLRHASCSVLVVK